MSIWNVFKKGHQAGKIQTISLEDIIFKTILLMENCDNYISEAEFIKKINELANNHSLAWELYCLVPIAFTRLVVTDVTYSNEVVLNYGNGKKEKKLLSNMNIYNSILRVVQRK
jgi:hypothetical protein